MTKFIAGVISAAALMAAVSVIGVTAGSARADTLPPCSKTLNDHCIQMGGETMKPSPEVKAKQDENMKAVKEKASEVGDKTVKAAKDVGAAAKKKWQELMGEKKAPSRAIPHGCSPATTPCY